MNEETEPREAPAGRGLVKLVAPLAVLCALLALLAVPLLMWQRGVRREKELKSAGAAAALRLAGRGAALVKEYRDWKAGNPGKAWKPVRLELSEYVAGAEVEAVDALVLYGGTLVAGAAEQPQSLKGRPEESGAEGVEVIRGHYTRGKRSIPCLQFKVPLEVPGTATKGTARLIVRLPE